ncbi:hypothetical protein TGDOM2_359030 [Toxoplasma gondii GAB2-2007-GAL-DOM2]|uniref:Transmembrane protein n=2 Tax=Toxoplasma gondii TaxID=5811 RepID=A0A425HSL1_TOXGO|nr:hypothetical protein TGDOM2_359030 [Toxoplasma gondii GAB2-2007-GAL-DOM2]RQX69067.1 hypothetical protein TGCAST_359030 [Toxoplasma gondii CAST]
MATQPETSGFPLLSFIAFLHLFQSLPGACARFTAMPCLQRDFFLRLCFLGLRVHTWVDSLSSLFLCRVIVCKRLEVFLPSVDPSRLRTLVLAVRFSAAGRLQRPVRSPAECTVAASGCPRRERPRSEEGLQRRRRRVCVEVERRRETGGGLPAGRLQEGAFCVGRRQRLNQWKGISHRFLGTLKRRSEARSRPAEWGRRCGQVMAIQRHRSEEVWDWERRSGPRSRGRGARPARRGDRRRNAEVHMLLCSGERRRLRESREKEKATRLLRCGEIED